MNDTAEHLCQCQCGCGKPVNVAKNNDPRYGWVKGKPVRFVSGHHAFTHRRSRSGEYIAWRNMIRRCYNPKSREWPGYGGRGITVCERWRGSFVDFFEDMGPRPKGLSLDRRNNDGNYEPENCRWATRREQANNTRRVRPVAWNGKTQSLGQWTRETGIPWTTLDYRLKCGWSVERTLTTPSRRYPCRRAKPTR